MQGNAVRIVRHTGDFDGMLSFYRDRLGLAVIHSWDRAADDRGALLALGPDGVEVEVLTLGDLADPSAGPPANLELSIEVHDADQVHRELVAAGVPIARELVDDPWGHRSFGIDDPGGLRIWVYHVVG